MSFSTMLEILQEKNKDSIVFIKTGVFYIATGKDAVFLNNVFKLKCICFKDQLCKIGIPENSLEIYLKKLERMNVSYVVYHVNHEKEKLIEESRNKGVYHKEKRNNKNCLLCKVISCYKEDKYMNAVRKLLEEEIKQDE